MANAHIYESMPREVFVMWRQKTKNIAKKKEFSFTISKLKERIIKTINDYIALT